MKLHDRIEQRIVRVPFCGCARELPPVQPTGHAEIQKGHAPSRGETSFGRTGRAP